MSVSVMSILPPPPPPLPPALFPRRLLLLLELALPWGFVNCARVVRNVCKLEVHPGPTSERRLVMPLPDEGESRSAIFDNVDVDVLVLVVVVLVLLFCCCWSAWTILRAGLYSF